MVAPKLAGLQKMTITISGTEGGHKDITRPGVMTPWDIMLHRRWRLLKSREFKEAFERGDKDFLDPGKHKLLLAYLSDLLIVRGSKCREILLVAHSDWLKDARLVLRRVSAFRSFTKSFMLMILLRRSRFVLHRTTS